MACEIIRIDDVILHARISGIMRAADMKSLQSAFMDLFRHGIKVRLLVTLENFKGWEKEADWGDVDFQIAHGNDIEKIAFVGDEKWKDDAFAFVGKGLRSTQIEFFPAASAKDAEIWIRS